MTRSIESFSTSMCTRDTSTVYEYPLRDKKRARKPISKKKISLYKTEICKSFETSSFCMYGDKCQFAHSLDELRDIERHPRYKTELCKTYTAYGTCTYGKRCCFIHAGSNSDTNTDLQDARNMPGDWKAPGIVAVRAPDEVEDIEMAPIIVDDTPKHAEALTEEENMRLSTLFMYKAKNTSVKKYTASAYTHIPKTYIDTRNSPSLVWLKPHLCFIFVDSGSRAGSTRALGKAPGAVAVNRRV